MTESILTEDTASSKAAQAPADMNESTTPLDLTLPPSTIYKTHLSTLRDIITHDRFGNSIPDSIVDLWLRFLDPVEGHKLPVPREITGFYGGDLRSSIPIELAHDSYKFIIHETENRELIERYATRMLIALGLLNVDDLFETDANLASLALWHKALAMARLPIYCGATGIGGAEFKEVVMEYEAVRAKSNLPESKLPQLGRLKSRLLEVAESMGNEHAVTFLKSWHPKEEPASSADVIADEGQVSS